MNVALPEGHVTGLGAVDVIDSQEAARIAIDEAPELPHVPELPLRGPWAEPTGRVAALLVDLPMGLEAGRWQLVYRPGRDLRRAASWLDQDLDAVEELWAGYEGPAKLQVQGPLTAGATVELRNGHKVVSDVGAQSDLTASLVEGLIAHVGELHRRVPGAEWVVQVDEPAAAAVTRGRVLRPSGWGTYAAVPQTEATASLRMVVDAVHGLELAAVLHCCDPDPDWALLTESGVEALAVPLPPSDRAQGEWTERLDQWWNQDRGLWVAADHPADVPRSLDELRRLRAVLGADDESFHRRLVLTAHCAGSTAPVGARAYADVDALRRRLDTL